MIEERDAIPMMRTPIDSPVQWALKLAFRPFLEQVANIDDQDAFFGGDLDPSFDGWMEGFQTMMFWLLEKDGEGAEVCVRSS